MSQNTTPSATDTCVSGKRVVRGISGCSYRASSVRIAIRLPTDTTVYFVYLFPLFLPYMFRALISPSSGVSQAVFIYNHLVHVVFVLLICCFSCCSLYFSHWCSKFLLISCNCLLRSSCNSKSLPVRKLRLSHITESYSSNRLSGAYLTICMVACHRRR